MKELLKSIYQYRGFIKSTIKRDFQSRYQLSMLGASWLVLQPLAMILVYTLVFANVMKAKLPGIESSFAYSIYLCAGVLTWGLFTEIQGRSTTIFLDNANLLKKISFPRICLPIIVTSTAIINFCIVFALFTIFLLISGNSPGTVYFHTIPVLIILLGFVVGFGIVLGVLNVFFRDVGQLMSVVIQFWFWLTPIVYPIAILPLWAHKIMAINPMAAIIGAMQTILVTHEAPNYSTLIYPLILAIIFLMLGFYLFKKHSGEIVDEI